MNTMMDPTKNGTLTLPGAHQLTLMGVSWAGEPSDDDFRKIDALSQFMERINAWVQGDLVVEHVRRLKLDNHGMAVRLAIQKFCEGRELNMDTVYERYSVARFYPYALRVKGLSWSHHRIVWASPLSRELHRALAVLKRALAEGWKPEELRAHLRAQQLPATAQGQQLRGFFPTELQRAEDYWSGQLERVPVLSAEEAREMLESMPCTTKCIDDLRAAAAKAVSETKESIIKSS